MGIWINGLTIIQVYHKDQSNSYLHIDKLYRIGIANYALRDYLVLTGSPIFSLVSKVIFCTCYFHYFLLSWFFDERIGRFIKLHHPLKKNSLNGQ